MITIDEFKKVEIRAGKILSVELVEGSDKLLKLLVDFGSASAEGSGGTKQIISGIRKYFENPQTLVGITCAFVANLEPRAIMGLESQAMIMAASTSSHSSPSNTLPSESRTGQAASGGEEEGFFTLLKMDCPPGSLVK